MGESGGLLWFAMEYVEGIDAGRHLRENGPLPVASAAAWGCQLLDALAYAHAKKFVHRDVKPSNLLVEAGGEAVRLADFGLARTYEASRLSGLTLTGTAGGTPAFMPPEQVLDMRTVGPAADQYATAATLYKLMTGEDIYPPCATIEALFKRILNDDPVKVRERRPEWPAGLSAALQRAMHRRPEGRWSDAAAFRKELAAFAG